MGLLDNSNNVITVDAVLTDLGREKISRNDGSFEIVRYTFGDDFVDYSLFTPNTRIFAARLELVKHTNFGGQC